LKIKRQQQKNGTPPMAIRVKDYSFLQIKRILLFFMEKGGCKNLEEYFAKLKK